jgi:uncharacterized protein
VTESAGSPRDRSEARTRDPGPREPRGVPDGGGDGAGERAKALRPVALPERVQILDVLRGIALLGVLIVNIENGFSSGWFRPEPATNPADAAVNWFVKLFLHGKAMSLLTFLFGLGFAIQLSRAEERGQDIRKMYARRLLVLLCIGLCHTVLWWGDVTAHYALLGFVLLAFRDSRPRTLLVSATVLVLVPQLVMALPGVTPALRVALGQPASEDAIRDAVVATVRGPDFGATTAAQLRHYASYMANVVGWYAAWILGRFLLGYYTGKRGLFDGDGAGHLPLFRRILGWGAAIGILTTAVNVVIHGSFMERYELLPAGQLAAVAVTEVSVLAVTAVYVSSVVLLMQRPAWRRVLVAVTPIGRMTLTVYLSQTVISMFIFYGWGLGLSGKIGHAGSLGIALAIYAAQLVLCRFWMARFRFGPVEWVWRTLAYGRRQPMRVALSPQKL